MSASEILVANDGPLDAAGRAWASGHGLAVTDATGLRVGVQPGNPTLLVPSVSGGQGRVIPGFPAGLQTLGWQAWRAAQARRAPVRAFALHPAADLARLPERVAVRCAFQFGGDQGNGLVVILREQGRWRRVEWSAEGSPTGTAIEVPPGGFAHGHALLIDPPHGRLLHSDGATALSEARIPGSTAVVVPLGAAVGPAERERTRRRAAALDFLRAPWGSVPPPLALDALDALARAPDAFADGAALEVIGRPGPTTPEGAPSALVLRFPRPGPGSVPGLAATLRGAAGGAGLAGAVGTALRTDLDAALAPTGVSLGPDRDGDPRVDDPAAVSRPSGARAWSPDGGSWEQVRRWVDRALPKDRDWADAVLLHPTRRVVDGVAAHDNHEVLRRCIAELAPAGEVDTVSPGWVRAIDLLLDGALHGRAATADAMVAGFRPPNRAHPHLARLHGEPLTLLWTEAPGPVLEDTWRWLLPRGARIRRAPNRLDDRLSPLGRLVVR